MTRDYTPPRCSNPHCSLCSPEPPPDRSWVKTKTVGKGFGRGLLGAGALVAFLVLCTVTALLWVPPTYLPLYNVLALFSGAVVGAWLYTYTHRKDRK